MPNCGSDTPNDSPLNISRISVQLALNREPNMRPATSETTMATRRAVFELTDLPTSIVSPWMRIVEPSEYAGRARIASVAEMKVTSTMSAAYASHRPTRVPSSVHTMLWNPSWEYHMTSVAKLATAKNNATTTAITATTAISTREPRPCDGRLAWRVMRGAPVGGLVPEPAAAWASSPLVSMSMMTGSSSSFWLEGLRDPGVAPNKGPKSKKDIRSAYWNTANGIKGHAHSSINTP